MGKEINFTASGGFLSHLVTRRPNGSNKEFTMCLIIESQDESYLEGQKVLRRGPSNFLFLNR